MGDRTRADFFGGGGSAGPLFEERDKGQGIGDKSGPARLPMTEDERRVAGVLQQARGRENSIPRKRIEELLGMDERAVKAAVEGLREAHDWPIGALRSEGGGYFLVVDEEDARVAFSGYWSQAIKMVRRAKKFLPPGLRAEYFGQMRLVMTDEEGTGDRG